MTNELQTVGAMHQCRAGEPYSTCVHCGALAETLNKPCPHFMRDAAQKLAAVASPTPQADSATHPIDPAIAADLERSDWTPEEALRWYAAGKHYDTVPNGDGSSSARILDNGAVASNALKSLSREYAEHKGDVALTAPQADSQPAPVEDGCTDPYNCKRCMTHPSHRDGMEHAGIPAHAVARAARAPADSVTAPAGGVADGWKWAPEEPTLDMGWAYLDAARESEPLRTHTFNHAGYRAMLAAAPTPPAQAADSVLEDAARLEQIAEAIRDYHYALDTRKHGGVAESAAFNSICLTMGMHWEQGKEADRRTALAANGGKP